MDVYSTVATAKQHASNTRFIAFIKICQVDTFSLLSHQLYSTFRTATDCQEGKYAFVEDYGCVRLPITLGRHYALPPTQ